MPSINQVASRDETRSKVLKMSNPAGEKFELWVEYYLNRLTSEPIMLDNDDVDPEEGEGGKRSMQNAILFCDVIKGWDLTGPLEARNGDVLVADGEVIPLDPHMVRLVPVWLTNQITNQLVEDVFPNPNGSQRSRQR